MWAVVPLRPARGHAHTNIRGQNTPLLCVTNLQRLKIKEIARAISSLFYLDDVGYPVGGWNERYNTIYIKRYYVFLHLHVRKNKLKSILEINYLRREYNKYGGKNGKSNRNDKERMENETDF